MDTAAVIENLKNYDGPELKLMEVCGTHTASIFKSGIRSMISPAIKLISGPGCPVCVTPAAYIDKCAGYAMKKDHILLTFGDMMKVPGTDGSLSDLKGRGASAELMYSPFEAVERAAAHPETMFVVAAVGFETTAPAYALAIEDAKVRGIKNLKFVTALKTVIPALSLICENQPDIDGFICPGHVSVIIGIRPYERLAAKYKKPFVIAGFEAEHILAVIYDIVRQTKKGEARAKNLYGNAVREQGNIKALDIIKKHFEEGPAMWRGLGIIDRSGLYLKNEGYFDGGSRGLDADIKLPGECRCKDVIVGRINPDECPMFSKGCRPDAPWGPCMVSGEGACGIWYRNRKA